MTSNRETTTTEGRAPAQPARVRELYPHPLIAREGWVFIASAVIAAVVVAWLAGPWWSAPVWIVAVFMLQFFRDPGRAAPLGSNLVISPADGRIVSVTRTRDPYLDREALKLSVFMNVFNVHSNRSPVDGAVRELWYSAGRFVNASLDKASSDNERNAIWIRAEGGQDVTCVQIAGLIARRILCYVRPGEHLHRGQRLGFIRFGSRVDVLLPIDSEPRVSLGDKVYGGQSVLAQLREAVDGAERG